MRLYAQIIDEETKQCNVGSETNTDFYKSIGMVEMDVEQAYNGSWYVAGYAPVKPAPTKEEISVLREQAYIKEVDKITCHINRLKDEKQTTEILAEIEALKAERAIIVAKIKEENPYPEE